ncbi:hypothetical protein N7509_007579 [Penicillium cosmopolitanum]|uniref:non-specific serine/threonine protein kinase n=1 Tax=Penicillium cosmopolitanum TaxID=1131564 RepID=A0A9X0B8H3_9EURO|nr:uncharacterized protein N7509_007579 [Penicillium cosmopolitanum]KAJ5392089.1 hypothetical protein N7509_007579 [Penicillium cosmopolitanum]
MKDNSRHYDAWTGIAVHRPKLATHYHYVTRPKWSPGAQDGKFPNGQGARKHSWPFFGNEQPALASVSTDRRPLVQPDTNATTPLETESTLSFTEKYGRCLEILHYGSNSTTRLHESKSAHWHLSSNSKQPPRFYAIKVYRHNILDTNNPLSHAPSCSQLSISNLHPDHPNILQITDLLYNERSELCLVTPFCGGGDLHELLSRHGALPSNEADCLLAQILRALSFLHDHDTAHRDVRLETILLTANGAVKLAGFGNGHIRRLWNESAIQIPEVEAEGEGEGEDSSTFHSSQRTHSHSQPSTWSFSLPWLLSPFKNEHQNQQHQAARGNGDYSSSSASFPGISMPYIPPEGLRYRAHHSTRESDDVYDGDDPRPADVWSAAIIYLAMIKGRLPWRSTRPRCEDTRYLEYLSSRLDEDGYPPIEALGRTTKRNLCDVAPQSDETDYFKCYAEIGVDA